MKKIIAFAFACCVSLAMAFDGREQPIKFVVPFAPAGGADSAIRLYEKYINELGYRTVIDYRPGADGLVGKRDFLEKNDVSGYTILVSGSIAMAHEDSFARDKGWTAANFSMVSDIVHVPNVLVASKPSGIADFSALKNKLKNNEKLAVAYGALQGRYASAILINDIAPDNTQALLVPYKGAAPALNNVVGGHADLVMVPVFMALPLFEADKVNVLFIGGSTRYSKMRSVPTAAELNTAMPYVGSWGVVLPQHTRKEVVDFYVALFQRIARDPRFQADLKGIDAFVTVDKMNPAGMLENYHRHMKLFEKYVH